MQIYRLFSDTAIDDYNNYNTQNLLVNIKLYRLWIYTLVSVTGSAYNICMYVAARKAQIPHCNFRWCVPTCPVGQPLRRHAEQHLAREMGLYG